jgi:DNA-binding MarR family transcriptional regulator
MEFTQEDVKAFSVLAQLGSNHPDEMAQIATEIGVEPHHMMGLLMKFENLNDINNPDAHTP